jgi:uncharacterized repeat protein (TIGR02543 family)
MKIISRLVLVFVFVFIFKVVNTQAYGGGDGSVGDPYQIQDADDVQDMNLNLNAYYVLVNDIDMAGFDFTPIGDNDNPFRGSLDGAGFTIHQLTMYETYIADEFRQFGLFGTTSSVTIKDLTLIDVDIRVLAVDVNENIFVGSLIGYAWSSSPDVTTITDVTVNGNIEVTYQDSDGAMSHEWISIGGLVGYLNGSPVDDEDVDLISNIDSSVNVGYIISEVRTNAYQSVHLGGVIGEVLNTVIKDSTYHGARVSYADDGISDAQRDLYYSGEDVYIYSGGIAGYYYNDDSGIIGDVALDSNTVGQEGQETNVTGYTATGGIVGQFYAYNYNTVEYNTTQYTTLWGRYCVGGIIGDATYVDIDESTIAYVTLSTWLKGENFGGIVGYYEADEPYIKGAVIDHLVIDESLYNEVSYVGGVAGSLNSDAEIERIYISNTTIHGMDWVGGLVGSLATGTFDYNTIETSTIESNSFTGGLIGSAGSVQITGNSFNGTITSSETVGGLIGLVFDETLIYQSYSLGELNGGGLLAGIVAYAVGDVTLNYVFSRMNIHFSWDSAFVGGLIATDMSALNNIHEAYFAGSIHSLGEAFSENIDPLVYYNNNAVIDSEFTPNYTVVYYDSNLYTGSSQYALPKTTVLLKTEAGYPNFEFDGIWFITSTVNDGYAFFDGDRVIVIFNNQDVETYTYVIPNYLVEKPTDPKRTGYVFGGWYTEPEYTNLWVFENTYPEEDVVLYAKWTAGVPDTGDVAGLSNALLGLGGLLIMATKRRRI